MTERLSESGLAKLPAGVQLPAYDRAGITIGIVHLGIGAFHRAHQAVFTDKVLASGDRNWGICGVSLRSPDTRDALAPQDGLYTIAVRDGSSELLQVVGSIKRLLVAPESPSEVLDQLADPSVRIVSLTVTEKGYCHSPATGTLDESHPDIVHDLANPATPRSAIGYIVEAIARRRAKGIAPFTVLSCDNLPANGQTAGRVIKRFAELRDPALGRYVADAIAFPSTMVDRIVPATTDADREAVSTKLGVTDAWPIMTEPFKQWIVEDEFPQGRPAWEQGGAVFVKDVTTYELMKLRLLNGSHSTLSYLGYLAGHETVAEAIAAPGFSKLIAAMMDEEITPTLPPLAGFDLAGYKAELLARFRNTALRHRTWQIAMDGSQKLPQRLLGTISARISAGQPYRRLALGVAGWMRYALGYDEKGGVIDVRDPLIQKIRSLTEGAEGAAAIADAYFGLADVFGDLATDAAFRQTVTAALAQLLANGAARTVQDYSA
ncbi:MAG TPA: mannitol dehydrogenase family protein [Arsenicitalea sp.]|nr:mannitol dehydrogenase family protein [Arsenicitalea sp.]